jgi:hypothetical protein
MGALGASAAPVAMDSNVVGDWRGGGEPSGRSERRGRFGRGSAEGRYRAPSALWPARNPHQSWRKGSSEANRDTSSRDETNGLSRRSALRPGPIHTLAAGRRSAGNLPREAGLHGRVDGAGGHVSQSSRGLTTFMLNGECGQLSADMHQLQFHLVWLAGRMGKNCQRPERPSRSR